MTTTSTDGSVASQGGLASASCCCCLTCLTYLLYPVRSTTSSVHDRHLVAPARTAAFGRCVGIIAKGMLCNVHCHSDKALMVTGRVAGIVRLKHVCSRYRRGSHHLLDVNPNAGAFCCHMTDETVSELVARCARCAAVHLVESHAVLMCIVLLQHQHSYETQLHSSRQSGAPLGCFRREQTPQYIVSLCMESSALTAS